MIEGHYAPVIEERAHFVIDLAARWIVREQHGECARWSWALGCIAAWSRARHSDLCYGVTSVLYCLQDLLESERGGGVMLAEVGRLSDRV